MKSKYYLVCTLNWANELVYTFCCGTPSALAMAKADDDLTSIIIFISSQTRSLLAASYLWGFHV